ncbi:hypothetical protein COT42_06135 [Candidatus Saganbacteria bacterium CG08_land_8_20_14_0_20_45_16]|uniref:Uncharacterized protein n=1 Tax=Candidatus Saganbacteria bacterium CG08_land_8_20_14_0_20_45_16 TaxID=2014293 RepID=A0A2H0XW25_UNCSA|nr:MAG: hypothetical protein COT42_06135 [Candidatus Saganbacteria bacterium CG08_land_8_20_14_0_20_45_16]
MVKVGTIIKVGVVFQGSKIIPRWFIWESRKYEVRSLDFTWEESQGLEKIIRFSVRDGINSYELAYNTIQMNWALENIC